MTLGIVEIGVETTTAVDAAIVTVGACVMVRLLDCVKLDVELDVELCVALCMGLDVELGVGLDVELGIGLAVELDVELCVVIVEGLLL